SKSPRTLNDALALARDVVRGFGQRFQTLRVAYTLLGLPELHWRAVRQRWRTAGYPSLPDYAPYTAHCLLVDVFSILRLKKALYRQIVRPIRLIWLIFTIFHSVRFLFPTTVCIKIRPLFL